MAGRVLPEQGLNLCLLHWQADSQPLDHRGSSWLVVSILSTIVRKSMGFPGGAVVKNPPTTARDVGSVTGSGWSLGGGSGNPLQYSCLENPMESRLQSMGLQRVRYDWACTHWQGRIKYCAFDFRILNVFENACVKSSGWVGWDKNAKLFSTDLNGKYVEGKSN